MRSRASATARANAIVDWMAWFPRRVVRRANNAREPVQTRGEAGGRLRHLSCTHAVGQHPSELVARGDVELVEHLAQVVGDGVLADEQPRADVRVREAVAGEPRDLDLLGGQLLAGLDPALADALAGGQQLTLGARGERLGAHAREQLERGAQLVAGVERRRSRRSHSP